VPRTPSLNPKKMQVIVRSRDAIEEEALKYFRLVVQRDGLDLTSEFVKMVNNYWKKIHPPPGNPQLMMKAFCEENTHIHIHTCDDTRCNEVAVWKCETIFPVNPTKRLCDVHTRKMEVRNEIISKVKLAFPE
jgi:hypothetical protein